ncbi:hypothetical protein M408DRAFT_29231 [Serendipita vermifera MAFF 305830]|uniref:DUF7918 domain-containing protein n=1 Tax=Serendipita vermifera MAFF 305830 TaxID=933852 RepID=A0A0C3ARD6_SERVB|nr:hypothetical protein M408DRAFT_29231 [Serendipita vermifera MAFF 305830]
MPTHKEITVRILCDEKPLEEYAATVNPEPPSSIECWVASQANKAFKVDLQFGPHKKWGWSCHLYCDGEWMRALSYSTHETSGLIGLARSGSSLCPMVFSEIIETASEEAANVSTSPLLGTIKVEVWRIKPKWTTSKSTVSQTKPNLSEEPVHESKKMLGGHRVKLGEPQPGGLGSGRVRLNTTKMDKDPHAVFEFRYRARGMLQALGYAPPAETKSSGIKREAPKDSGSVSTSESDGEEDKLTAQLYVLQQKKEKLRKNKEERRANRRNKRVKVEGNEIEVPPTAKGEVIELSSD